MVYLNGYGFPCTAAVPMLYADTVACQRGARLCGAAAEPGADPSWQPAPLLLVQLADDGKTFNERNRT